MMQWTSQDYLLDSPAACARQCAGDDPVSGSAEPLCSRCASPRARDLRAHRRSLEEGQPMTLMIDHEMEAVARQLWPSPQRLQLATGGLFNRVVQVQSPVGTTYLKRFTDAASSGDFPPLPTSASQRCLVASNWHELALRASAREPPPPVPSLLSPHTPAPPRPLTAARAPPHRPRPPRARGRARAARSGSVPGCSADRARPGGNGG